MKNAYLLLAVTVLLCGCSTVTRSKVADTFGYSNDSSMIEIGPYQVHYGSDGNAEFLLVAKGNHNLYSVEGTNSAVFVAGRSFVDFADRDADGIVDEFMIHLRDKNGNDTITLVDENADGVIDFKIDFKKKTVYDWKNDHWVDRKQE